VTTAAVATASTAPAVRTSLLSALRRAGPMAVAGLVANGSNVVVTVIIAHLLSTRGYGSMAQLIAIYLVLSMPGSALLIGVVRRVAAWDATGRHERSLVWIASVRRRAGVALVVWAAAAVLSRSFIARALNLPHPDGVAEVLIAGGGWALLCVERGLLQSRQSYSRLARNLCVEAAARGAVTVVLIAWGLGPEGAALGLVAAMVVSIADARLSLARHAVDVPVHPPALAPLTISGHDTRRHLATDVATALAALGLLAGLQNVDVLIVGREAPLAVGAYGAISVASTAVVFAALVLAGYLLPEAVLRSHRGEHALHQLAVALGLIAVPVAGLSGLAFIAPTFVLRLVFGPDKTAAAPAFVLLALAMGCLAASVLFTHYLLGVGRRAVIVLLAVGLTALVIGVGAAHGHPWATARAELACQAALAAVLAATVYAVARSTP
jgi:O-antigen/teichoic acid export membrane protein